MSYTLLKMRRVRLSPGVIDHCAGSVHGNEPMCSPLFWPAKSLVGLEVGGGDRRVVY